MGQMDQSNTSTILSFMHADHDWLSILQAEMKPGRYFENSRLIGELIEKVIQQELPISILEKLIIFGNDYGKETGHYPQWIGKAVVHSNKETFFFISRFAREDLLNAFVMVFEESAEVGRERLLLVLKWLDELGYLAEMFEYYVLEANDFYMELVDIQKLVLTIIIEYLDIDAFARDWGAKDSPVNNWLFSLRDQV